MILLASVALLAGPPTPKAPAIAFISSTLGAGVAMEVRNSPKPGTSVGAPLILSETGEGTTHTETHQFATPVLPKGSVLDPPGICVVEVGQSQPNTVAVAAEFGEPPHAFMREHQFDTAKQNLLFRQDAIDTGDITPNRLPVDQRFDPSGDAEHRTAADVLDHELDRLPPQVERGRRDGQPPDTGPVLGSSLGDVDRGLQQGDEHHREADRRRNDPWSRITHLDPLTVLALVAGIVIEATLLMLAIWFVLVVAETGSILLVVVATTMSGLMLFSGAMLAVTLVRGA